MRQAPNASTRAARRRRFSPGPRTALAVIGALAAATGIAASSSQATPIVITGTTTQLTTNAAPQVDPAISGDIVVYTDQRNGNDDVYFSQIGGSETQVTTSTSAQRLNDVSGHTIVYSDLITSAGRSIRAYDTVTQSDTLVPGPDTSQNPRIDGSRVVYEVGLGAAADVWTTDLATGIAQPVATTSTVDLNPVISGTRVVYQRHATTSSPGDIVLYDLATGQETVLGSSAEDERRPDIDGDIVVWDTCDGGGTVCGADDIVVHNLATGTTTRLSRPGLQRSAHVSGDVVSFDDDSSGNPDVGLYHVPTGTVQLIAAEPGSEFLNDISGNRIVYTSNRAGNNDIWLYEFTVQLPEIAVAPATVDFGDVNVGNTGTSVVHVSNTGALPLTVSGIALAPSGSPFAITPSPALPATVAPGATLDVPLAFAPTAAGVQTATLTITSDDLDEGTVQVPLTGRGVVSVPPPAQQITDILAFFDSSVAAGTLQGTGSGGVAAARLVALRLELVASRVLIQLGLVPQACALLADARNRTDGQPNPSDLVRGPAAAELRQRIETLRTTLGCS